jgi:hypothetical protein
MKIILAAVAAISLAACGDKAAQPEPQGETTGAAMPDTSAAAGPGATAPDAGVTGTVPTNGAPPPVQPTPSEPAANNAAPPP